MFKKRVVPGIVVVFLTAVVVGLFLLPHPGRSVEQPIEERTTDVKIMEVEPAELTDWVELPASVEPYLSTEVPAEVGGKIDWIGPKEGSLISKGASILRIDQRTFQAQVDEAQASYNLALNDCKRIGQLYEQGIISKEKVDQCETNLATSQAKLEMAKLQLEKATIHAPVSGVLNELYFDVGEYVRQGDKIADVVVIDPVKVLVKIPEKDIPYIKQGEKVNVVSRMLDKKQYQGTISYISVVGDLATRTYSVEITVPNPSREILPSMITRVRIVRQEIPDAITVPLFSVIPKGDFKAVFVEKDGRAEERQVKLGILDNNRVQILDGLRPHDHLIVEGHRELSDGEAVRVQGVLENFS